MTMNKRALQRYSILLGLLSTFYLLLVSVSAQDGDNHLTFTGILKLQEGPSICQQGRFELHDCQNNLVIRVTETDTGPDLDTLVGQYVELCGPDVGVECRVIAAKEAKAQNNPCNDQSNIFREGVLAFQEGPNTCLQGRFELRNCDSNRIVLLSESENGPNLEQLVGQYVRLRGPNVGVECLVISPTEVTVLPNICVNPPRLHPREGIVQVDANGRFVLVDCQNNIRLELVVNPNVIDMSSMIGQFVRVKG
ncbi:MAG: hypothetical protein AB1489_37820, partial [Acidobacteriota bacterium]